jgi:methylenetetrahydrofolate dehydrogenase (NADP+)/methenyltetrahydrofolate cyclohydrolase
MESVASILEGKSLAKRIREQVAAKVIARKEAGLAQPGLATILVGEDAASQVYVRNKHRACEKVGIQSFAYELAIDADQSEVLELIQKLNNNAAVHGILLQLPVPKQLDDAELIRAIYPLKDVDGLHPENVGLLAQKGQEMRFAPATPSGIMRLLEEAGTELEGANAVVLGRSNIVGLPISLMLLEANATVTVCHSRSKNLAAICKRADVLIAAVGKPKFVRAAWVKPGATVIDVGVNRVDDSSTKRGYRLVGDVDFDEVSKVAAAITPVPGGVGPMTIAMLLENTLRAAELHD